MQLELVKSIAFMVNEVLYRTPRFDVCVERVDQTEDHYFVAKPDAVLVVPYSAKGVLLIRVARRLIGAVSLELPGGRIEPGETPLIAAKRELLEEANTESTEWAPLGITYPLPSVTTERVHLFSARVSDRSPDDGGAAASEAFDTFVAPFEEAKALVLSGSIDCSIDAYALLLFLGMSSLL